MFFLKSTSVKHDNFLKKLVSNGFIFQNKLYVSERH